MRGAVTSHPHVFLVKCLVKRRGNSTDTSSFPPFTCDSVRITIAVRFLTPVQEAGTPAILVEIVLILL
jgi:hypothetical protein